MPKMKVVGQGVRKLEPEQEQPDTHTHTHTDRQTNKQTNRQTDRQTHATENITFPHSRLVIIIKMPSVEGSPTAGVCILCHSKVIG